MNCQNRTISLAVLLLITGLVSVPAVASMQQTRQWRKAARVLQNYTKSKCMPSSPARALSALPANKGRLYSSHKSNSANNNTSAWQKRWLPKFAKSRWAVVAGGVVTAAAAAKMWMLHSSRQPDTAATRLQNNVWQSAHSQQENLPDLPDAVARKELLQEIRREPTPAWESTKIRLIYGMGGTGKTWLALAYAHEYLNKGYQQPYWIQADSRESILESLRAICVQIGMQNVHLLSDKLLTRFVHTHLRENPGWLLVVDGAKNSELLNSFEHEVERIYPSVGGYVLVTSRAEDWPEIWYGALEMPLSFTKDQARSVLQSARTPQTEAEKEAMESILDYDEYRLPIALKVIASRLKTASFAQCLATLNSIAKDNRVATSLQLCFDAKQEPDAWLIGSAMAYYNAKNVPRELLRSLVGEQMNLHRALAVLLRHSIIRTDDQGKTYDMHPLQQRVWLQHIAANKRDEFLQQAATAMAKTCQEHPQHIDLLYSHMESVAQHAEELGVPVLLVY